MEITSCAKVDESPVIGRKTRIVSISGEANEWANPDQIRDGIFSGNTDWQARSSAIKPKTTDHEAWANAQLTLLKTLCMRTLQTHDE